MLNSMEKVLKKQNYQGKNNYGVREDMYKLKLEIGQEFQGELQMSVDRLLDTQLSWHEAMLNEL